MKETLSYFIDAIVYGIIFTLSMKLLEYFKIDINYIYIIIFTLILFVGGKILLKRFMNKPTD